MLLIMGLVLYLFLLAVALGTAFWKGGRTERKVAAAWLVAAIASQAAALTGHSWYHPEWAVRATDVVLFIALVAIVHGSERYWPLWAASFQLAGVLTHLTFILQPSIVREAYAGLQQFWGIPILLTIIVGTVRHRQIYQGAA